MDLTRPVVYRGLALTGVAHGSGGGSILDGLRLTRARYTDVPAVGYTEKSSLREGMDASDVYLGGRTISMAGEVFGYNKGRLFDILDIMRDVFSASSAFAADPAGQGYHALQFSQPTLRTAHWPSGFIDKVLYCRPVTQGDHDVVFGALGAQPNGGFVIPYTVALQAKDPLFYAPVHRSLLIVGGGSAALENRGFAPAPLRIELHIVDPALGSFQLSNSRTVVTITIPAGGSKVIVLDSKERILTMSGVLRMDLVNVDAGPWPAVLSTPYGGGAEGHAWSSSMGFASPSNFSWPEVWY